MVTQQIKNSGNGSLTHAMPVCVEFSGAKVCSRLSKHDSNGDSYCNSNVNRDFGARKFLTLIFLRNVGIDLMLLLYKLYKYKKKQTTNILL